MRHRFVEFQDGGKRLGGCGVEFVAHERRHGPATDGATAPELAKAQAERIIACTDLFVATQKFGLPAAHDITDEFGFALPGDFFTLMVARWTIRKDVATGQVEQEDDAAAAQSASADGSAWLSAGASAGSAARPPPG